MRAFVVLSLVMTAVLCACVTQPPAPPAYQVSVRDEPQNHRFVFRLISSDDRALCVDGDAWPSVFEGAVSGGLELLTAGSRVRAHPELFQDAGMVCGKSRDPDCGTWRIEARAIREVVIDYTFFGDPDALAKDPAKHFDLRPNFPNVRLCRRPRGQN